MGQELEHNSLIYKRQEKYHKPYEKRKVLRVWWGEKLLSPGSGDGGGSIYAFYMINETEHNKMESIYQNLLREEKLKRILNV